MYKMTKTISTTIPDEVYNLAKEKAIPWNEALIRGIKEIALQPFFTPASDVKIEETHMTKVKKLQRANAIMQEELQRLNDVLEKKNRQ
jgi:hypothetical protein